MKWSLFLCSLGLLLIGVSGTSEGSVKSGLFFVGIIIAVIGLILCIVSARYKKYADRKAKLKLESEQYEKEQQAIKKQISIDKMNANVQKSREASAKNRENGES